MNHTQSLIPSIAIENVIHLFGIFGNLNIILATIQSKLLHNNCNLVIAMQALFDLFGEFGGLVEVILVYTANKYIDAYLCFFLQLIPAIGINMSTVIMLMIGIDRVIAIKYPIRYLKFNRIYYLIIMHVPGVLFNLAFVPISYVKLSLKPTMCVDGEIYPTLLTFEYVALLIIIYVSVIFVYIYMIYLVKTTECKFNIFISNCFWCRTKNMSSYTVYLGLSFITVSNASIQITRKILKSIVIVMVVTVGGWMIGVVYSFVAILIDAQNKSSYATSKYFINFTYVGMAASYYIYFYNSTDYRRAFQSILVKMMCGSSWLFPNRSAVAPIAIGNNSNDSMRVRNH